VSALAERLVTRLAGRAPEPRPSGPPRRGFLASAALGGAALAVKPWSFLTRPADAYTSLCGTDASCSAGYSAFCCTINAGRNTCPPNTFPGGWWKADRSSYCGGGARYYIDCNAKPGYHFRCHCADNGSCDHRLVACNVFRYGQCNTQIAGVTAVVCRQISCRPPWEVYPHHCGRSSATDNNTAGHTAPCLTHDNTYPPLKTFPDAPHLLYGGHRLHPGQRLTSADRHTTAVFYPDGNLDVLNQYGVVWRSHTADKARGGSVTMHRGGNLTIEDSAGRVVWQTNTPGPPAHWRLNMRNDGQLVIEDGQDPSHVRWSTHTHTR
jgi:hypothetical protein